MTVYHECLRYELSSAAVMWEDRNVLHLHPWNSHTHISATFMLKNNPSSEVRSSGFLLVGQTVSVLLWGTDPSLLGSVSVRSILRGLSQCSSSSSCLTVISMTCVLGLLASGLEQGVFAEEITGHVAEPFVWDVSPVAQRGGMEEWLPTPVKSEEYV